MHFNIPSETIWYYMVRIHLFLLFDLFFYKIILAVEDLTENKDERKHCNLSKCDVDKHMDNYLM